MLGFKPAVPINFRIIETKCTIGFVNLNIRIRVSSKEFEAESPILALFSYLVDLVDYSAYCRIFVQKNLGDELFEWEILAPEI